MLPPVFLALGSNLGDREKNLDDALRRLGEIAPDLRHPLLGLSVAELRARCPDRSEVRLHTAPGVRA
jgi:hypothetical protein